MTTAIQPLSKRFQKKISKELVPFFAGDIYTDTTNRVLYSTAACLYSKVPQFVVAPKNADDIALTVKFAKTHQLPVTARGAGSSLCGSALSTGIVIDTSVYMNRIVNLDVAKQTITVLPGLVCGNMNAELAKHGLFFPPDPSSANYSTMGGIVANNSSGPYGLKYGTTVDYIESLAFIDADGVQQVLSPGQKNPYARKLRELTVQNADLISRSFPKISKNSSGYRLDALMSNGTFLPQKIFAASEGTLGILTRITLRVLPKTNQSSMVMFFFDSMDKAARAISRILATKPLFLEMLDNQVLDLIKSHRPDLEKYILPGAKVLLFAGYEGDTRSQVLQMLKEIKTDIREKTALAFAASVPEDKKEETLLLAIRKAAVPILNNLPGPRRVIPFIEDVVVPPEKIPEYFSRLYGVFEKYRVSSCVYGHAGDGNFHTRPLLDLSREEDRRKMRAIGCVIFELAVSMGGTISGEHGDGLTRTYFLADLYKEAYPLFKQVKTIFDPDGRFNPGIKIFDQKPYEDFLRDAGRVDITPPAYLTSDQTLAYAEKCSGCGTCRTTLEDVTRMCPVYRALGIEAASPRAKMNIIRAVMSGLLAGPEAAAALGRVFDLCLECRNCENECPTYVRLPLVINEMKSRYARHNGLGISSRFLILANRSAGMANFFAPLANRMLKMAPLRWILERVFGIGASSAMFHFAGQNIVSRLKRLQKNDDTKYRRNIYFYPDLYAGYSNLNVGESLFSLLKSVQIRLICLPVLSPLLPAIVNGDMKTAEIYMKKNRALFDSIDRNIPVLFSEPSTLLTFREEYRELFDYEIPNTLVDCFSFLDGQLNDIHFANDKKVYYHEPCHSRPLAIKKHILNLLARVKKTVVVNEVSVCCGIAGTKGMKSGAVNAGLSLRIGTVLFDRIEKSGADIVVTECATCRIQIEQHTEKIVLHPLEYLWRSIQ